MARSVAYAYVGWNDAFKTPLAEGLEYYLRRLPPRWLITTLGQPWWGNGYVPEAARAVLNFVSTHLGIERVTGMCDYENARSARVFQKLGFRSLGIRDRAIVHPAIGPEPRPALLFECDL